ncbi:uncharacterized protein LOC126879418 [Diabrotica virgifera virgifera]|uniref:Uncharacterized protein n=1 Tax=Diabrotica virgifera virgifera TaxID=50390 RepID=A0ABM5JKB7_DIAVI|nr:uncharacterized protein LOC126879418 [Diabrotica virgifera virgifera]
MLSEPSRRPIRDQELAIDSVVATQSELGPSIPDGGYGWVVFIATLFFQALIPSLRVSFGIFLAMSRLQLYTKDDQDPKLWDDGFMYAPVLFAAVWAIFDPTSRFLISNSTWPRLVATAGTCLTCAGLLFLWMGLAEYSGGILFPLAGIVCGIGASIEIAQCEILLAQYFRVKHAILANVCQGMASFGFVIVPVVIGHNVLSSSLLHVVLWYQAIILQGLICNMVFKKPAYLKSRQRETYNYITSNPDDEEDILSKNSRELQIKRQNSTGTQVMIEKHALPASGPTDAEPNSSGTNQLSRNWETFEDEEEAREKANYEILNQDWETFEDDEESEEKPKKDWVKFEDEPKNSKNLKLELSFAETAKREPTSSLTGLPKPLFSDLPVNNNNTYSYDIMENDLRSAEPVVFMPTTIEKPRRLADKLEVLKQLTFYKSLLTVLTTKFSMFIFYTLFPLYVYQEVERLTLREMSVMVGLLSISGLLFTGVSHWINIDKKRRPICFWVLCWVGAFGYFMLADSNSKQVLIFGAIGVILSIATLQYVGMPILGLTLRGETSKEFSIISTLSGCALLLFLVFDMTFRTCFKLMALLHFFTGAVWFANYIYKRIRI